MLFLLGIRISHLPFHLHQILKCTHRLVWTFEFFGYLCQQHRLFHYCQQQYRLVTRIDLHLNLVHPILLQSFHQDQIFEFCVIANLQQKQNPQKLQFPLEIWIVQNHFHYFPKHSKKFHHYQIFELACFQDLLHRYFQNHLKLNFVEMKNILLSSNRIVPILKWRDVKH